MIIISRRKIIVRMKLMISSVSVSNCGEGYMSRARVMVLMRMHAVMKPEKAQCVATLNQRVMKYEQTLTSFAFSMSPQQLQMHFHGRSIGVFHQLYSFTHGLCKYPRVRPGGRHLCTSRKAAR